MERADKPREVSKGDENSKAQAATLLGSSGTDSQSPCADSAKRRKSNMKIIIGVLLLCLLIIILVVVVVLKRRCALEAATSCRTRCASDRGDGAAACRCDPACQAEGTCCLDYQEVCVAPMRLWACTKFRCGERRLAGSLCSCADDCAGAGDCCSSYSQVCRGEQPWVEGTCEDLESPQCPAGFPRPPVILVSLDGFRAGYLKAYGGLLPVISKLKNCGTSTPHMRPAYPTKTFPNHYTIVTGLYPESHGIVDNKMYDVTRNASFSLRTAEKYNEKWYQGEPVWITAMRHNLRTGTFFWPGSDVPISGTYPNFHHVYDRNVPFEKRITTILQWLDLPEGTRPGFYTLYLEEPDGAGHRYGPMSSQVIEALQRVDRILGMLMDGLKQRHLHRCVNLVVLSDHGMEEASCAKAAYVSAYQDNIADFTVVQGPAARIRPKKIPEEFFTFDYEGLVRNLSCRAPDQPMRPYLKEHLPKRFHFANNVRIERAHLYMKAQWQAALKPGEMKYCSGGFHGSDNLFRNMQAIFMGYGPGIKSKTEVPPFESIEVYNLLCDLLGVPPAPNNGTHGSLNPVLRRPVYRPVYPAEQSSASSCTARSSTATDSLGCSCSSLSPAQEEKLNQKLINGSSNSALKSLHLPFGIPRVLQKTAQFCVLQHADYISGYSRDLLMPLWLAYTLDTALGDVQPLRPDSGDCVRADVRLPATASQTCLRYQTDSALSMGLLHPPNLGPKDTEFDSLLTSNMVPMFPPFKDVWAHIHDVVLQKYLRERNGVNVMSGPIFDQDFDGNYDTPRTPRPNEAAVPTHYFLVLTSCRNSSTPPQQCQGPLEALSFILPHRPDNTEACAGGADVQWVEEWMQFHVARVRDIELLTGLSFYHDQLSITDTLQLKTFLHSF
ncbi:ectonucleotide pyrophosphatase/phosphodiesterase family member 1 [Anguilla anguilla]|uniref:ectonucleotide pyrophosphatase/phosphodiesterase family member 1 n=1 Tax=Anguilla anguilla TaxID=7936 RepID=UPI0015ABD2B6|nr:ectonucleotide pyrophosphatase/phosphodiesterase family member 1 [Anguilla anguilla]